jgi:tetratricopeptide (TPR) repeat protein
MYLRGSKWSYTHRRKRSHPWRIILLIGLVGAALYVNQVVVPATPPLFVPTPTQTRAPESYVTEAENLLGEGKIPLAVAAYQQAVEADPKNANNFVALAKLQVSLGAYQDAVENSENALVLTPNNANAYALRGWAKGLQGDYLEALGSVQRAIEIDPNNATAHAYLSEIYALQIQEGQGDLASLDNATNASRTAIALDPNLLESHRARGTILELTGNYEEAVSEFTSAVAIDPNQSDLHLALGRNYRMLQQYEKAIEEFNRANALNPNDSLANTYISRTYAAVGEYSKAIQFAEAALEIDPTDPYMYGNLGVVLYRNQDIPRAIQNLKMAIQGGQATNGDEVPGLPLDYGRIAEYYYVYGLALAKQGSCGEALQISQTLLQNTATDEVAVYNAQEMVNICQGLVDGVTPSPAETIVDTEGTLPEAGVTPEPPSSSG